MKVLSDRELMGEWLGFFGVRTGLRLLGWCAATAVLMPGPSSEWDRRALLHYSWGALSTRYDNVHRLEAFAGYMVEHGWRLAEDQDESFRLVGKVVG